MTSFHYQNGSLYAEGVSIEEIARTVPTPFYVYSEQTLRFQMQSFAGAAQNRLTSFLVCFAVKSNANPAIIKILSSMGAGADIVSEGELLLALSAGVPADRIVFSGVGKTREALALAVERGIKQINLESEEEAILLNEIARQAGRQIRVAVRVNPDVDAHTHHKITTGKKENKFGVAWQEARPLYQRLMKSENLIPVGIDVHVGSQLLDTEPFAQAFDRTAEIVKALKADGVELKTIDVGGGLGVAYQETDRPCSPDDYMAVVAEKLGGLGCEIVFEPGRFLTAPAGVLVSRVVRVKHTAAKDFVVLDAGMNDLIRPAIYDAYHGIKAVRESSEQRLFDVVGPICESSDVFGKERALPIMQPDELVVLETTGAYGSSMGSNYNFRPFCAEILVNKNRFAMIRQRQTFEEMLSLNRPAPWL
ncbi:MAG: diaminopimelate decarboxylase [Alphaproteobacteria bacterium]|nr:diaminopimelate decarboxylase [Alphaproteobacteria bacterium]